MFKILQKCLKNSWFLLYSAALEYYAHLKPEEYWHLPLSYLHIIVIICVVFSLFIPHYPLFVQI